LPRIDVHQHLWPEELISALSRRAAPPRLNGSLLELVDGAYDVDLDDHRLDRRLELLDRDGIDVAVISLQSTLGCEEEPELVAAYHDGMEELVAASGGRLAALACEQRRDGFVGACVSAHRVPDDVGPLAAELKDAGQFLFVHPGIPRHPRAGAPAWWPVVVDYAAQMEAAFLAWITGSGHDVPVVFALLAGGAPFQLERLASRDTAFSVSDHVYLETSSYGRRALELCLASPGREHLVYGSDTPVIDSRPTLRALADLGDAVREAVCETNPARLLR
jgi:predicted TIM-barrel fold metal-dependent hydrolase